MGAWDWGRPIESEGRTDVRHRAHSVDGASVGLPDLPCWAGPSARWVSRYWAPSLGIREARTGPDLRARL